MTNATMERSKRFTGKRVKATDFNKRLYLTAVTRAATMSNDKLQKTIDDAIDEIAIRGIDCFPDLYLETVAILGFLLARRPK